MDQIPNKPPAPRRLKMVGKQSMDAMLNLAVSRALGAEMADLGREKLRALQQRVRENFQELIAQNARTVQGVSKGRFLTEMDSARREILKRRSLAEAQMGELERRAAMLRNLHSMGAMAEGSDSGFAAQLEQRFLTLQADSEFAAQEVEFVVQLAQSAASMARAEWNRMLDECAESASDEVDNYRRRISKLSAALEETEVALDEMSKLADGDPGVASIYRRVRGLQSDDSKSVLKRSLLNDIFKHNISMQEDLRESS